MIDMFHHSRKPSPSGLECIFRANEHASGLQSALSFCSHRARGILICRPRPPLRTFMSQICFYSKPGGSRIWQISVPVLNDDGGDVSEADVYVALLARAGDVWHILIPVRIFCSRHSEALGLDSNKQ